MKSDFNGAFLNIRNSKEFEKFKESENSKSLQLENTSAYQAEVPHSALVVNSRRFFGVSFITTSSVLF